MFFLFHIDLFVNDPTIVSNVNDPTMASNVNDPTITYSVSDPTMASNMNDLTHKNRYLVIPRDQKDDRRRTKINPSL